MRYKGVSGSAKEIILILAFAAGLIIMFYLLAKREAESAISGIGKGISDAVGSVGKGASGVVGGIGQGISDVVATTSKNVQDAVAPLRPLPLISTPVRPLVTLNPLPGMLAIVDALPEIGTVSGRIPLAKLYKNGKWYLLVDCDRTGYNCKSSREATWLDQIALSMATDVTNI